jgi:hypothetical protein
MDSFVSGSFSCLGRGSETLDDVLGPFRVTVWEHRIKFWRGVE